VASIGHAFCNQFTIFPVQRHSKNIRWAWKNEKDIWLGVLFYIQVAELRGVYPEPFDSAQDELRRRESHLATLAERTLAKPSGANGG
jgi:hypothetical protein